MVTFKIKGLTKPWSCRKLLKRFPRVMSQLCRISFSGLGAFLGFLVHVVPRTWWSITASPFTASGIHAAILDSSATREISQRSPETRVSLQLHVCFIQ